MPRPIFPGRPGLAIPRNWKTDDDHGTAFTLIKWEALQVYAIDLKKRITNSGDDVPCWLSTEYSKGGCHIVRQICFQDGTNWAVRVQLREVTETSCQRLVHEVNTIQDLQNQSKVPVPKVIAYEKDKNPVGVAFMISEFISACTAMDFVSDQPMDRAIPQRFKRSYFSEIAAVQVRSRCFVQPALTGIG
jgi:aminoglycoside phosphotransferase (APT) family kinase protein